MPQGINAQQQVYYLNLAQPIYPPFAMGPPPIPTNPYNMGSSQLPNFQGQSYSYNPYMMPAFPSSDCTKEMMSSFKAIDELKGTNLEFELWKSNVTSHLASHPIWKDFIIDVSPPQFIDCLPVHLESADSALFAALKSRMDVSAKKLISRGVVSGIELIDVLTAAYTVRHDSHPTQRSATESPSQNRRGTSTIPVPSTDVTGLTISSKDDVEISPLAFAKGLVVGKQLLTDNSIAYKGEIDHLAKYGVWPQTWRPHQNNLLNLAMQMEREYEKMKFKSNDNQEQSQGQGGNHCGNQQNQGGQDQGTYERSDRVTRFTSAAHRRDFMATMRQNQSTLFTSGW
eukprot:CAMPEP_0184860726 /NCGR_PEP_ID=MMETSP0580-20130426/5560_1 /TAXON_ID=1118495 /ORGANISM="Dactyliosolen fragilissimus" /LENGTH=340 /DNA_ID=CAMNT_0027357939 /DNA_START=844 /DNA_END=1864 /DNA_ORIENTATION=+